MTLKELVEIQSFSGEADIKIIKNWFILNDKESEGITLIAELSESKSRKLEDTLRNARTWIPNIPELYEANKRRIPKDVCQKLTKITYMYLLDMPLSDKMLDWAKENIPTIKMPKVIFVPMVEWLRADYGIEFMKEEEQTNK